MSISLPHPSSRLVRAAAAEHEALARHRARLSEQRDALLAELRRLDEALAAADERVGMLARLAGEPGGMSAGSTPRAEGVPEAHADASVETLSVGPRQVLHGPGIREVAVQVLLAESSRIEAIHYRRWYELVTNAGYAVAGKDPLAVFLTQVTRSPVVRKATQPGVYEIERDAAARIRARLQRLQLEFREASLDLQSPADLAAVRGRRHELDVAISRQERALEEALRVLGPGRAGRQATA